MNSSSDVDPAGFPVESSRSNGNHVNIEDPGQEIMMGVSGEAVVVGDNDIESEEGSTSRIYSKPKKGCLPNWLSNSSRKVKIILSVAVFLLLAFVALMAVGLTQLSPASGDGESSDGVSSAQLEEDLNNEDRAENLTGPTTQPSPDSNSSSESPTNAFSSIPITESEVNIALPAVLENLVPDFSDGISGSEEDDWGTLEAILKNTISFSLMENLPDEYIVEQVFIEKFDDFDLNSEMLRKLRDGRSLENEEQFIHQVIYSSSVTVSCVLATDCASASVVVIEVANELSQTDYIRASFETNPPTSAPTNSNPFQSANPTSAPTSAPTSSPSALSTVTQTVSETTSGPTTNPTMAPTAKPSDAPTRAPITPQPTDTPRLSNGNCSFSNRCGMCTGGCSDDSDCANGLSCFKRGYLEYIPGCRGPGNQGQNYCYNPFADGLNEEVLLLSRDRNCSDRNRCDKCEGDCNSDDDCSRGLYCFRRNRFELVPGCAGQGVSGWDYCFNPKDIPDSNYKNY